MATPRKPKSEWKKDGRPPAIDATVLQKLEDAFSNCLPDEEACLYAGIAPRTLYYYQEKHPDFLQRKQALKLTPNIAARKTIVGALGNVSVAQWWLIKKAPSEFGEKTTIIHDGKLEVEDTTVKVAIKEVTDKYEEELKKTIAGMHKKTS